MNTEVKRVREICKEMGELFLADEKKRIRARKWDAEFSCEFRARVPKPAWKIEGPGCFFLKANREGWRRADKTISGAGFLVKENNRGNYELIRYFDDGNTEVCVVPECIKYVRESGFFNAQQLRVIRFKGKGVVLEEGAFIYMDNLEHVEFPENNGRYRKKQAPGSSGHYFLMDSKTQTLLYYLPTAERRHAGVELSIPPETRKIGRYAFSGTDNISRLYADGDVKWSGEDATFCGRETPKYRGDGQLYE